MTPAEQVQTSAFQPTQHISNAVLVMWIKLDDIFHNKNRRNNRNFENKDAVFK